MQGVGEVIGKSLDRKQCAHARIGTDRRTSVPGPDMGVAHAPTYTDARKFEIDSKRRLGQLGSGFPLLASANTDECCMVQHSVDEGECLNWTGVQQPVEGPVVPSCHRIGRARLLMTPD